MMNRMIGSSQKTQSNPFGIMLRHQPCRQRINIFIERRGGPQTGGCLSINRKAVLPNQTRDKDG